MTTHYIAVRDDSTILSNAERDFVQNSTSTRIDGRERTERRPIHVHLTRSENSASCIITLGSSTRVISTVSGELVPPQPDRPQEGVIAFTVDLSPGSSKRFRQATPVSTGGGSTHSAIGLPMAERYQKLTANHILRCLERCIVMGGALDTEALCVLPGQYVWKLHVDVVVLDAGGNLVDASVAACLASLRHYRKPATDLSTSSVPKLLSATQKEPTPLPLHHTPLTITFAIFQVALLEMQPKETMSLSSLSTALLIDPTYREELCQTGSLTIAMNVHQEICLLDFSGGCELSISNMRECHLLAAAHIQPLCQSLEKALEEADERALQERLALLKIRQGDSVQLPPHPEPAVPFFQEAEEAEVEMDTSLDETQAKHDVANAEEEAYRIQALDYNRGHVASKLRDDDRKEKKTKRVSKLLEALLSSAQNNANEQETVRTHSAGEQPYAESTSGGDSSNQEPATVFQEGQTKNDKMFLDENMSDDEEEMTVQLRSEFNSIEEIPPKRNVDEDTDEVDDLAAAITSKKKKKGKKK